jgi:FkbM family methyltransferase
MTSKIQRLAAAASVALGRESWLVRALRPTYESALDFLNGKRGIEWEINGVPYRIDPHFRHQMSHEYEAQVASFLRTQVMPGQLCFDVGANVGVYALQLAHWSAPDGRIVAFEPNPEAATVLSRHLAMNRLSDRVRIERTAVSDAEGEADLYLAGADGMARLGAPNKVLGNAAAASSVRTTTLDKFSRTTALVPDWLLIDIEGLEIAALRGGVQLISERRAKLGIVVEMHPNVWVASGTDRREAESLLEQLGLSVVPLTGQSDPLADHGVVYLAFK